MKYNLCVYACSLSFSAAMVGHAQAQEHSGPNFKGEMAAGVLKVDDRDTDAWGFSLEAGFDGVYSFNEPVKISYDFVVDFANAVNDNDALTWTPGNPDGGVDDDIYIRTARLIFITDYGALLFAPRTPSGQWGALYSGIDNFYYNRFHAQTGDIAIFGQPEQSSDVLAYVTPKFGGGFRLIGSTLTLDDLNGEDQDVYSARLVYESDTLEAGVGHSIIKSEQLPTDDDYQRSAASLSYDFGSLAVAGTYEVNRDHPSGDFDSFATNVAYDINDRWTASLGYAEKNHDNDPLDEKVVVADIKHHLSEKATLFLETGQYEGARDNIAMGISVKF